MAKKNQKNCRRDNPTDTTAQTPKDYKHEVQNYRTEHPDHPDLRNSK